MNRVLLFSEKNAEPCSSSLLEGRVRGLKESAEDFTAAEQCPRRARCTRSAAAARKRDTNRTKRAGGCSRMLWKWTSEGIFLLKLEMVLEPNRSVP